MSQCLLGDTEPILFLVSEKTNMSFQSWRKKTEKKTHHKNKTSVRPQVRNFFDKFSLSTCTEEKFLHCVIFFLGKCACSKAS